MRIRKRRFLQLGVAMLALASALVLLVTWSSAAAGGGAQHVRWDIVSQNFPPASPLTTQAGATDRQKGTTIRRSPSRVLEPSSHPGSRAVARITG